MSGHEPRVRRLEAKCQRSNQLANEVLCAITTGLRAFAEAIKLRDEFAARLAAQRTTHALALEDVHRYRPCHTLRCAHCRGDEPRRLRSLRAPRDDGGDDGGGGGGGFEIALRAAGSRHPAYQGETVVVVDRDGQAAVVAEEEERGKPRNVLRRVLRKIRTVRF